MPDLAAGTFYKIQYAYMDKPGSLPVAGATDHQISLENLRVKSFYFADADNAETFIPPPGTVACSWQPSGAAHLGTWSVGATGLIFTSIAGNALGWLHCLCNGTLKTGSTTSQAPVAKGTAGWVNHANGIALNHKAAAPATVTSGRYLPSKAGLKLEIYEVAAGQLGNGDVWLCQTGREAQGVVAVAWQCNTLTDDVAPTIRVNGDVVLNSTGANGDWGWLWVWRR